MPARTTSRSLDLIALYALPGLALCAVLVIVVSKVIFKAPEFDECELLHGSWLIAHGGRIWVTAFEHHSPLFNTINAVIFNTDSPFFVLYAKLFTLATYLLGGGLFALACSLWLEVETRYRRSFALYAVLFYFILTWPVDIGVVRPENYSMLALMIGGLTGYFACRGSSHRAYLLALPAAFFLALAVAFSPRSVFLSAGVVLAMLIAVPTWTDRLRLMLAGAIGVAAAAAINLMIAPFSGFILWMVEFNAHMLPYTRALWQASYGSVGVGLVAVAINGFCLVAWLARRRPAQARAGDDALAPFLAFCRNRWILAAQILVVVSWIYVFADHHWGRQSFGGIAVATAFYVAVVISLAFEYLGTRRRRALEGAKPRAPWSRPVRAAAAVGLVIAALAGTGLAYLSVVKVAHIVARLHPDGMLKDISLMRHENTFRLHRASDLLLLNEARNLGEWLLWSKRYCELFRNERILVSPHRHPICVRDGTYYWYMGEEFRAMARAHVDFKPNPPYTVTADVLKEKPALLGAIFLADSVLPNAKVEAMLKRDYVRIRFRNLGDWGWLRKDMLTPPRSGGAPQPPADSHASSRQ